MQFEPRPYQREIIEHLHNNPAPNPLYWGRPRYVVGYDPATAVGDKSVISLVKIHGGHAHILYADEVSHWPNYKWYRNPIKWWQWRSVMRKLLRYK